MKTFGYLMLGLIGLGFLLVVMVFGMWWNATNAEVSLRNQINAKQKLNEASFDTMWKILKDKADISGQYEKAFREIYPDLIKGRYNGADGKSLLMKFVTESNPNFDTSLFKDLMVSVESERKRFLTNQQEILDLQRAHDDIRTRMPSKFFVGHVAPITVTVITSDRTEETFRTGKDNAPGLFENKK